MSDFKNLSKTLDTPKLQSRYMENTKKHYHLASANENIQLLVNKHTGELDKVLNVLKRDYDKMTLDNNTKEKDSEFIKKKIDMLEKRSKLIAQDFKEKRGELSSLQSFAVIKHSTKEESNYDNQILKKGITSLKKDILVIQNDVNYLIDNSARLDKRIEREHLNQHLIKSKSNKVYTRIMYKDMKNYYEENEQKLQLGYYQEIIKQKNSFIISADDRKVRQKMAAEQARKTPFDPNEIGRRKKIMLLKLYNHFLAMKMNKQLQDTIPIEETIYELRTITGSSKIEDIINVLVLKNKQYSYNQLLIDQKLKDQKVLKSKLDDLKKKHQEIMNNVVITNIGEDDIRKLIMINPQVTDENEEELISQENKVKKKLLSLQELKKDIHLEYNKVIMNINYMNKMYSIDQQKRKKPNEDIMTDIKREQSGTINESTIVNQEDSTIRKTEETEVMNEEDKAVKDYNTFLRNSYETFTKLFLCYSKHDFIKSIAEKKAVNPINQSKKRLSKSSSMCENFTSRAKKGKLCLSSSVGDLTSNKKYINGTFREKDDDVILPEELKVEMKIMNSFLSKKKKEREDFLKQIQFQAVKPSIPMTTKH